MRAQAAELSARCAEMERHNDALALHLAQEQRQRAEQQQALAQAHAMAQQQLWSQELPSTQVVPAAAPPPGARCRAP